MVLIIMRKTKLFLICLLTIITVTFILINDESVVVENLYSNNIYKLISKSLRLIFGWIYFSIGDILYFLFLLSIIYCLTFKLKSIKKKYQNYLVIILFVIISFYLFWGLNYKRISFNNKLNLNTEFKKSDLIDFTESTILEINEKHLEIFGGDSIIPANKYDFEKSVKLSVENIKDLKNSNIVEFVNINYEYVSVKKSIFSKILTYMGFSGYLNPFTNEANINTKIPQSDLIFVINHEISHQLGVAKESEANFLAYNLLVNSKNEYLKFCGFNYALKLSLAELSKIDYDIYSFFLNQINNGITKEYINTSKFWKKYDGNIEKISKKAYDFYLKQNNISSGIQNYNESLSLILNYKKK